MKLSVAVGILCAILDRSNARFHPAFVPAKTRSAFAKKSSSAEKKVSLNKHESSDDPNMDGSSSTPPLDINLVDVAIALAGSLANQGRITVEREKELVELALQRNLSLLTLVKQHAADSEKFLQETASLGTLGSTTSSSGGSYLENLSSGPPPDTPFAFGSCSYLDNMSRSCDEPGEECAGAVTSYLGDVSSGKVPLEGSEAANVVSYLDALTTSGGYLESMPLTPESSAAPYVENVSENCNPKEPSAECAAAVTAYLDVLETGTEVAEEVGEYLGTMQEEEQIVEVDEETIGVIEAYSGNLDKLSNILDSISEKLDQMRADELAAAAAMGAPEPPTVAEVSPTTVLYADTITEACVPGEVTSDCDSSITNYLGAVSEGSASLAQEPVTAITSYLDSLSSTQPPPASTSPASTASAEAVVSSLDALSGGGGGSSPPAAATSPDPPPFFMDFVESDDSSNEYTESITEACEPGKVTEECADTITDYLGALSSGAAQPTQKPVAAITSYLDAISSSDYDASEPAASTAPSAPKETTAPAVASYVQSVTTGEAKAPTPKEVGSYLDALSSGELRKPSSGVAIISYLSTLSTESSTTRPSSGGGKGPASYLDSITEACEPGKKPTNECTGTITDYLGALSSGTENPSVESAAAITSYIDELSPEQQNSPSDDAPLTTSAPAVDSYLEAVTTGDVEPPTPDAVGSYFDAISSGDVDTPYSESAITSYLSIPAEDLVDDPIDLDAAPFLSAIFDECDVREPTESCAEAITWYLDALASGETAPSREISAAITLYLDAFSSSEAGEGATSSKAVSAYLDALGDAILTPPTSKAVASYLSALFAVEVTTPSTAAAIHSYMVTHVSGKVESDDVATPEAELEPENETSSTIVENEEEGLLDEMESTIARLRKFL